MVTVGSGGWESVQVVAGTSFIPRVSRMGGPQAVSMSALGMCCLHVRDRLSSGLSMGGTQPELRTATKDHYCVW